MANKRTRNELLTPSTPKTTTPDSFQQRFQRFNRELRGRRYIDLSKDTQFSEAWIVLAIVITLTGLLLGNRFLTGAALILLVVALLSRLWTELSLFGLHYRRHFSEQRAFLGETVELTLEVRNQKVIPLTWLQIVDQFPADLPVADETGSLTQGGVSGEFRTFWSLGPFQQVSRRFTISCTRRGYHRYGPATVSTGDPFGLFDRKARPEDEMRIIVYPRLYTVTELGLPAKNPFGERRSQRRLFEDPLRTVGIRDWQPGDDLHRVHWKATARHQQLLSRTYEPSQDPQLLIFLNVATMARYWQGVMPELLERTISVAGSLAALGLERRIPVGLVANGVLPGSDQPIRLLPGRNPEQLTRILELLAAVQPLASGHVESMILAESPRLPWGATVVVVTAVVTAELLAALLTLDEAGRQIVLFSLADTPPADLSLQSGILTYHLPHLVDDLIAPQVVTG